MTDTPSESEPPTTPVAATEPLPAAPEPAVPVVTAERKQSRLTQIAAWVAIVAGVVVIVAVVFGAGFCLGAHSNGGGHRHHGGGFHGHQHGMMHHGGGHMRGGGPGMFQPPFGQWGPWSHGGPDQGPAGQGSPAPQGPSESPAKPPRP